MKNTFKLKALAVFVIALLVSTASFAQKQPASPAETATGTVAGSTITINYSSPAVKGRKIWGGLVPYDKVWRTGANNATTFETSKDIQIGGKTLKAGKYTLYSTPSEKEWKFMFNSKLMDGSKPIWGIKMDGSTTDDSATDVLVATATPMKSKEMNERLTFKITPTGFVLLWENLAVPVSIK